MRLLDPVLIQFAVLFLVLFELLDKTCFTHFGNYLCWLNGMTARVGDMRNGLG
jgi:hypothetical protein